MESPPLLDRGQRVHDTRPFEVTGIDFAGLLHLKNGDKA